MSAHMLMGMYSVYHLSNLVVALQEKSEDHRSHEDMSS